MAEQLTKEKQCNCTMHQSMVGDGCEVCNPELALEYANERIAELEAANHEMTLFVTKIAQERDQYKQIAALNAETIKEMQQKSDRAYEEERHRSSW